MSVKVKLGLMLVMVALVASIAAVSAKPAEAQTASGSAVVSDAQSYLGVPYVYGGASRAGVDCSGLVVAVFADLGVYLPHSSYSMYSYGTPVYSPAPGDLVFSDYGYGFASHVGIATGGGYMIDAPYPGTTVRYDPIIPSYVDGYKSVL